jgi:hypothetical protein
VKHQFATFQLQFCHVRLLASGGFSVCQSPPCKRCRMLEGIAAGAYYPAV